MLHFLDPFLCMFGKLSIWEWCFEMLRVCCEVHVQQRTLRAIGPFASFCTFAHLGLAQVQIWPGRLCDGGWHLRRGHVHQGPLGFWWRVHLTSSQQVRPLHGTSMHFVHSAMRQRWNALECLCPTEQSTMTWHREVSWRWWCWWLLEVRIG